MTKQQKRIIRKVLYNRWSKQMLITIPADSGIDIADYVEVIKVKPIKIKKVEE